MSIGERVIVPLGLSVVTSCGFDPESLPEPHTYEERGTDFRAAVEQPLEQVSLTLAAEQGDTKLIVDLLASDRPKSSGIVTVPLPSDSRPVPDKTMS